MQLSSIYKQTSLAETLESHLYMDSYSDVKDIMHSYKFSSDQYSKAKKFLLNRTLDICLETYICSKKGMLIYTSPPSTMYVRGEKKVDSMFELLKESSLIFLELIQKLPDVHTYIESIFSISENHLKNTRAQHIDGNRKSRVKNLSSRYYISLKHILYISYCIHIKKIQHFSYVIIDDVSSTGATLLACKETVLKHMSPIHRKNPHISYDVKIFSLSH